MESIASPAANTDGVTLAALLREGRAMLAEAGIERAEHEAIWILEAALNTSRLALTLERTRFVDPHELAAARALLARRAAREPLQYLLGAQDFCGLEFEVDPSVFIPRPETELLIDELARRLRTDEPALLADIGTGSGCIAVAAARVFRHASVYAVDLSEAALAVAGRNVVRHGVQARVTCLRGDLFGPLRARGMTGAFAAILSNPPYIADPEIDGLQPEVRLFEPRLALSGGQDGLDFYRRIVNEAWEWLAPGGVLIMEVGQDQAASVCELASRQGRYGTISTRRDMAGIDRIVCVDLKG